MSPDYVSLTTGPTPTLRNPWEFSEFTGCGLLRGSSGSPWSDHFTRSPLAPSAQPRSARPVRS